MGTDKPTARALLRGRRASLDRARLAARSAAVCTHVQADPRWGTAKRVAAFVGVLGEPDTGALLQDALAQGKQLWLPRVVDAQAGVSQWVAVTSLGTLVAGPFGLLEPPPDASPVWATAEPVMGLELVLVPGLGFDRVGGRIGHGPGHYDRLLAPVRTAAAPWRLGVCFSEFLDAPDTTPIPMAPHDVHMHAVVTDQGLVLCPPAA